MSLNRKYIEYLLLRYLENKCSRQEREQLLEYLHENKDDDLWESLLEEILFAEPSMKEYKGDEWQSLLNEIQRKKGSNAVAQPAPIHHLSFWKRSMGWAAAIIIIFVAGYFILNKNKISDSQSDKKLANESSLSDIAPGTNKAKLTKADGSIILLDSVGIGTVLLEGNTKVVKLANGQIVYIPEGEKTDQVYYNTMTTPRAGQYQLTLPDGTKVWLNASSSITYPTAFTGNERNVSITGEVYFEVVKNVRMPFQVKVNDMKVEVLGTHFNINAYTDEDVVKTTLLEGAISIQSGSSKDVLKPGDQARVNKNGDIHLLNNADLEEAVAWKNGGFYFDGASIEEIMRQVARWYDVKIVYENKIPEGHYRGKPSRSLTLSQMLKVFEYSGLKFKIEKNTIIIM